VLHARPLNTALDPREVMEVKRSGADAESKKQPGAEESAKAGMPNQVLQRSARSESRRGEPVRHARPLNTALDRREASRGGEVIGRRQEGSDVSDVARCEEEE
jgi:hypothetical protein